MADVEVRCKSGSLAGYTLVMGFPDVGLAGAIAAEHIAAKAGMREVGHIQSDRLVPLAVVEEGIVARPISIYVSKRRKLALIRSYVHLPPRLAHEVSRAVVGWAHGSEITEVICFAGVLIEEGQDGGDDVYVATTTGEALGGGRLQRLLNRDDVYPWTGSVYGFVGQVLLDCIDVDLPAVSLVVETRADYPDARAAATCIRTLNRYLNLRIDLDPLMEEANLIEEQMKSVVDHASRHHQQMEQTTSANLMFR